MIPIVQPIQFASAALPATSHAASPDQHSNQLVQQSSPQQSPLIVIPAFGQPQSGARSILIQPVSTASAASGGGIGDGSLTLTHTSASASSPPPAAATSPLLSQHAVMIMASGSSPINRYHQRIKEDATGTGGGSKKRKTKSKKQVIILNLKEMGPRHEESSETTLSIKGRHESSCSPSDNDKGICREKRDRDNPVPDAGDRFNDDIIGEGQHSDTLLPARKKDPGALTDELGVEEESRVVLSPNPGNSSTHVSNGTSSETVTIPSTSGVSTEQSPSTTPLSLTR